MTSTAGAKWESHKSQHPDPICRGENCNFEDPEENLEHHKGTMDIHRSRIPQARRQTIIKRGEAIQENRQLKFFLIQQEVSCTISYGSLTHKQRMHGTFCWVCVSHLAEHTVKAVFLRSQCISPT